LHITLSGEEKDAGAHFYEVLEPGSAKVVASFANIPEHLPALTVNEYGRGKAIYLATEAKASTVEPVLAYVSRMAGLSPGPQTPDGVYARVVNSRTLYVNMTASEKRVVIDGTKKGLVNGRTYVGELVLAPQDAELLE
jgi:beta-galactosidase